MKRLKIAVLFGGCSPEYRVMLNELSSEEKEECLKILQKTNWTITRIMYTKRTIARQSERLLGEQGLEKAAESKKSADRNDERPRAIWISKREMRGNSWISAISSHFWTKSLGRLFYQNNLPNMAKDCCFNKAGIIVNYWYDLYLPGRMAVKHLPKVGELWYTHLVNSGFIEDLTIDFQLVETVVCFYVKMHMRT